MGVRGTALLGLFVTASGPLTPQGPPSSSPGPAFEVISIRRNAPSPPGAVPVNMSIRDRPDGGVTMTNIFVVTLIQRAYPEMIPPADWVGLPDWVRTERYDVSTTSTLANPTAADRVTMWRALLADRFKLLAHIEMREQPVYDLVLSRGDRRLGAGLTPVDLVCPSPATPGAGASAPVPGPPPNLNAPPPPCTLRVVQGRMRDRQGDGQAQTGDLLEGDATLATLAQMLRVPAGRLVVEKTLLPGAYRMRMNFDMLSAIRGPDVTPPADAAPSVFSALPEQLGLKLEPSRAQRETLIIDRLERPTEN